MKKPIIAIISLIVLAIIISALVHYKQDSTIVGTWINSNDAKVKLVFTSDQKEKVYYNGEILSTYTYVVSKTPTPCGVDMSGVLQKHPDVSFLIETNTQNNEKDCEQIYALSQTNLTLRPFGHGGFSFFERQQ